MNTCISVAVHKICYSATETVLCYRNNLYGMMLKICQSLFLCSTQQMCSLKHLLTSNSTHLVLCHNYCVVPEKKNPYPPHGRSLEIPRGKGLSKGKI